MEVPITVWGEFLPQGKIRPLAIRWQGEIFPVEQVYGVVSAGSVTQGRGRSGQKYRCRIAGQESLLRLNQGIWYLQMKPS